MIQEVVCDALFWKKQGRERFAAPSARFRLRSDGPPLSLKALGSRAVLKLCYTGSMKCLALLLLAALGAWALSAAPERHPAYEPKGREPSAKLRPDAPPRLVPVSARRRYGRTLPAAAQGAGEAGELRLRGWRGERVSAQALAESAAGFKELAAEPCLLTDAAGKTFPARVDFVRCTLADGKPVADILDGEGVPAPEGIVRPFWLTADIPADAAPGVARGTLAVRINGRRLELPVALRVDALTLPPPPQWRFHLDLWQHPDATARWHDVPMWSPEHFALLRPEMERLAAMGQKTITATLVDEAWNGQTYDRFRSMVGVTRKADGAWAYDYSAFDAWVAFMRDEIGLRHAAIHCYTLVPWSLRFPYFDEAQGRTVRPRLEPGTPDYENFWGPFLDAFVLHLREKGWEGDTALAMDERPDTLLLPALDVARRHAPALRIVSACDAPSAVNEAFANVSYAYGICERLVPLAAERRRQGKTTTFYVCCNPARPNTFMASALAESEWLPVMAAHYGLDGLLRWAWQSWVANPLQCQDFTSWPSGDTALLYPGNRASLRLEALRNGIETCEKIALLRERAAERGRPDALAPLDAALEAFTVERGRQEGVHEADLDALDRALEAAADALAN